MDVYIALLRGINVSGQKLIKMDSLRKTFEGLGFAQVQTYIQSGNVLFTADAATDAGLKERKERIEQEIERVYGFTVPVVVKRLAEWHEIIAQNPYVPGVPADANGSIEEGASLYVSLLGQEPDAAACERLLACSSDADAFTLVGGQVYILCRSGYGKSLFSNNFIEKKLGVYATTRNWQTMNKLAELGDKLEQG